MDVTALMAFEQKGLMVLLFAVCIGGFMTPFTSSMLNLALVSIGNDFSIGSHSMGLVNTVFLLTSVMAMAPLAKAADVKGQKPVYMFGVILLLAATVLCALAPTFGIFILGRALMGIGASGMTVTSVAMVVNAFPPTRRGWAIGVNTTCVYIGIAIGPTVGGVVTDILGWRILLFVIVPFAITSLMAIAKVQVPGAICPEGRIDAIGSLLYCAGLALLMYGVINLPAVWAISLIAIGVAIILVFIGQCKRSKDPVMDISVYGNRSFRYAALTAFMNYGASYSVSFFLALYLQTIGSMSATEAGMVMFIQPIMQVLLTTKMGALSDRIDKRILPTAGMGLISVGVIMIIFLDTEVNLIYVCLILLILGIGFGMFSAPNTSRIMASVAPKDRNLASGSVSLMRQTGMLASMGVALCCISVILGSTDNINPDTFSDFILVIRCSFIVCLIMCIVGMIFSSFKGTEYVEEIQ